MSVSSIKGAVGIGIQTAKGAVASATPLYTPALTVDLDVRQDVAVYPPEVGGVYFSRGSYKRSVRAEGGWTANARPEGLGAALFAWMGQETPSGAGPIYSHTMTPTTDGTLPWCTLVRDVSGLFANVLPDSLCRGFDFMAPKADLVRYRADFLSAIGSALTDPIEVDVAALGTLSFESGLAMTTCTGVVTVDGFTRTTGSTAQQNNAKAENITLQFRNEMTDDELSVGSYFLDDLTLLSRSVKLQYELVLRDAALWRLVYRNNSALTTGAWSPTVYRAAFIVNTTIPDASEGLTLTFGGIDYQTFPVQLEGNQLIRVRLEAQVTLDANATNPVTAVVVNKTASY